MDTSLRISKGQRHIYHKRAYDQTHGVWLTWVASATATNNSTIHLMTAKHSINTQLLDG